jgi:hypothetical protein
MGPDPKGERLQAVLGVPAELLEYERWLADQRRAPRAERDYLFAEERARFEPRKDDVVVALSGLEVQERSGVVRLVCPDPAAEIDLGGVSRDAAEQLLAAIDGQRCLLEVRLDAGVDQDVLSRFLRAAFGRVVFAPEAVRALETALPGVEVSRFASPPYSIERPYWQNMISVRQRFFERGPAALVDRDDFVRLLRELHVIAVLGTGLDSFYKPSSPVSDRIVAPGALFVAPARIARTPRGTLYFDGPRVNVSFIGGEAYHRALCEGVGDAAACEAERDFSEGGLAWGQIVTARSEREAEPRPWFLPPRPILDAHFDCMRTNLATAVRCADAADTDGTVRSIASFHQAFVRLHPFHCANQSIAMNLVNALLCRVHGAGIPHFVLDLLALRLSTGAYEKIFARAVSAWLSKDPDPARRLADLRERKRRALVLIDRSSAGNIGNLIAADRDAGRWALLAG